MPANPLNGLIVESDLVVIVKGDGTVDPRLSRYLSNSVGDEPFHRQALETIKSWRFEPGKRRDASVRSGFQLRIRSDTRNDTIPATLEWSYRTGQAIDTLQGTWRRAEAERPFAEKELDSMYLAVIRHLTDIRVLRGSANDRYCIVLKSGDTAAQSRLTKAARQLPVPNSNGFYHLPRRLQIADIGCKRADSVRRIILPRLVRTESGRAAFVVNGDFLPNYPAGFRGRSWNAYTGRCVGQLQLVGPATMHCDVVPEGQREEQMQWFRSQENFGATGGAPEAGTKPVRVGVYYKMRGAFQTDTAQRELAGVPQLADFAVTD